MDLSEAISIVRRLYDDLRSEDPDQEVAAWAIPTLDAGLSAARAHLPADHQVAIHVADLLSAANAGNIDQPIRAFDLRLQVGMLLEALEAQVPPLKLGEMEMSWYERDF